jgi:predicted transcriptional regulator
VQLGYGESTSVRLDITVPATTAAPGAYALSVSAASLGRPGLVAERMLYIIVKNFDPGTLVPRLKVFPPSPQLKLTEGDTLSFPVSVLCTGSDIVNVSIRITSSAGLDISYEILVPPENLSAGENYTFMVVLHAGHPNGTVSRGTIEVQAVGEGVVGSKQQIEVTLQRAPRPALVVSMEGLGIALAIFLALGGIAVGWNEVVLLALLNLFMPLYVKLRRVEVLDHYTRGQIHGYIIANPGEHYNSIRAQLRLKNGTLAYHLRVLEREGFVKTARDGMFKRFYPEKASIPRRKSEFSAIQEIVLENVSSSPGITQNELARKMGVSSQVVNYHVRNLVNAGVLRLEREGRVTRCFPK